MSTDVKQVTEVAREIADVGRRARKIADGLRSSLDAVNESLEVAEDVSRALQAAGAELRGVLGIQTNNPPAGDDAGVGADSAALGGPAGGPAAESGA